MNFDFLVTKTIFYSFATLIRKILRHLVISSIYHMADRSILKREHVRWSVSGRKRAVRTIRGCDFISSEVKRHCKSQRSLQKSNIAAKVKRHCKSSLDFWGHLITNFHYFMVILIINSLSEYTGSIFCYYNK